MAYVDHYYNSISKNTITRCVSSILLRFVRRCSVPYYETVAHTQPVSILKLANQAPKHGARRLRSGRKIVLHTE